MAKSKFEYVRLFEREDRCLPNTWMVVRVDGKGFHRFSELHSFDKPNDSRALRLMNRAAVAVFREFRDISIGFGHSDEFSFVFRRSTEVYNRRSEKLVSLVTSLFSSAYVYYWGDYFGEEKLQYPPAFDGRIVLYPTDENLRDYLSWRQADVHVNNLYNTCYWNLVLHQKLTPKQAEDRLKGTLASDKNELLFKEFNINYNNLPEIFKKGTTMVRKSVQVNGKPMHAVIPLHCDIIGNKFWVDNPEILKCGKLPLVQIDESYEYFFNNINPFGVKFNGDKENISDVSS
ncbi:hypothetical protein AAG570_001086 [Ranatra chinensis]|uniref:Probable tRNA(His) guanylyltransferase n=1 Tax=Ranatra chinensis TaxID=642074 RepID=A0ABD0YAU7_9HEMI